MAPRIFRKQYIVDNMQYKILAIILIYVLVAVLLSGLMMFLPNILELTSGEVTEKQQQAARELLVLNKRFWPVILTVSFIIAIHSVFLFHRIFGPLYRFRGIFKQVTNGDLSVVTQIRKNDFLHSEEIAIREMITSLKTNVTAAKISQSGLHNSIYELEQELQNMDISMEEIRERLQAIQQQNTELQKELDHFTT